MFRMPWIVGGFDTVQCDQPSTRPFAETVSASVILSNVHLMSALPPVAFTPRAWLQRHDAYLNVPEQTEGSANLSGTQLANHDG